MQAAAAVIPGTDGPSISLQRERGLRMGKGKRKHWSAVLLKKVWWYLPKTLFYHLVFRPFYLPELRSKCQFVTLTDTGKVSMIELPMSELPAKPEGRVRLVAVSDTHDYFQHIGVPPGDVLIHSGDIVFKGGRGRRDYEAFNRHLGTLPHPVKLVIVGNHDWWVDSAETSKADMRSLLSHAVYLEDDAVTLAPPYPLRVYGSPQTPLGSSENTAFQYVPEEVGSAAWGGIPYGLDVLVTHATPAGHSDRLVATSASASNENGHERGKESALGDTLLAEAIEAKRPRVVVCGHDHSAYGASFHNDTLVLNPSIMNDVYYYPVKLPIVYDLPLRPPPSRPA